jgi:hypothetical protein
MNPILMSLLVECCVFLGLSDDDVVQPDVALRYLELIAHDLQQLGDEDRRTFIRHVRELARHESQNPGNEERVAFLVPQRSCSGWPQSPSAHSSRSPACRVRAEHMRARAARTVVAITAVVQDATGANGTCTLKLGGRGSATPTAGAGVGGVTWLASAGLPSFNASATLDGSVSEGSAVVAARSGGVAGGVAALASALDFVASAEGPVPKD